MNYMKLITALLLFIVLLNGCDNPALNDETNFKIMIKKSDLTSLPGKRVYFAHQSVGYNIIEGIKEIISKNNDLDFIKIITLDEYLQGELPDSDSSFYIIHSKVGINTFPDLKIKDFQNKIDSIKDVDAAFMKFCFVDITRKTNVNSLYKNYMDAITGLEKKYEKTRFLYFTCPISIKENFVIGVLKAILRKPDDLNKNRNRFNNLIRKNQNIDIFDLAYHESHDENNTEMHEREFMLKKYATSDGGHLNNLGSEKMAYHLLLKLNSFLD